MRSIIVATAIAAAATPCLAAASDFNGVYAGVQAGYGDRRASQRIGAVRLSGELSSVQLDGFVGYDLALGGGLVAGIEGEVGTGGRSVRLVDNAGTLINLDPKWNYAVTGGIGVTANDRLLVSGRAGYGAERVTTDFRGPIPSVVSFPTRATDWSGWLMAGGGLEFQLLRSVSVRGEYRYLGRAGG
jgi:opacity protein-like surface antigen